MRVKETGTESCEVNFLQHYRSNDSDDANKTLILKRENGTLKVTREVAQK